MYFLMLLTINCTKLRANLPQNLNSLCENFLWASELFLKSTVKRYYVDSKNIYTILDNIKCILCESLGASLVAQQLRIHLQCGRPSFDPWMLWRKAWQPTPLFLPGESHGRRNLVGYSPRGSQRVRQDWLHSLTQILRFFTVWATREASQGTSDRKYKHIPHAN